MTTAAHRAIGFGVRFNPSPEEAVAFYLRRRIVGEQLPDVAGIIHEADVYRFEPKELAAAYPRLPKTQSRFFFTTCKRQKAGKGYRNSRTAGPGSWVGSGGKKKVENSAGETIGSHETLKYAYNDKSRKSEWLMDEYRCCGLDRLAVVDGAERVLCRVYVSPNSKEGSVTLQESAAGDRLLGMQELATAMAAAAEQQQKPRQEPVVKQQQQQPRRQEPVAPVLPAITQPQAIKKPPRRQEPVAPVPPAITQPQAIKKPTPPRALDPRQPCVRNTLEVPKRPAPQVVEPPRPKRMRPTVAPLEVTPVPRPKPNAVGWTAPFWWPAAPATPQRQASPKATPRRRPRKSSGSQPVAPPPPPAAEAPSNVMEDESWSLFVAELENDIPHEEAGNGDKLARLAEPETAPEEDHAIIQEEAGNDDDEFVSWTEFLASELEEMPAVEEQGGKIQDDEEEGQHQHARSLEGLVADERGDDVVAQDALDVFSNIDDAIDDIIDYSLPLSAYSDIQY